MKVCALVDCQKQILFLDYNYYQLVTICGFPEKPGLLLMFIGIPNG